MRIDGVELDHKRRQCRSKADKENETWVIYTNPDDFEPKVLCDCSIKDLPAGREIVEYVYAKAH